MSRQSLRPVVWLAMAALAAASIGCHARGHTYDQRYRTLSKEFVSAQIQMENTSTASNPVVHELTGPHSVDEYLQFGLSQNSEILENRLLVESLADRVPQAASLPDPMLGATAFPAPVQTAAGEQNFALSMNQRIPWRGKLATRASIAEQDVNAARANLAAVELKVAEQIKNSYFQLYFVQQAMAITRDDQKQLELIGEVVEQMYRVKREVTQQDVLQVQVALARLDSELINLEQQKTSAQAKLARLLHLSPETKPEALDSLPQEQLLHDIQELYRLAIEARPELHSQLSAIEKDWRSVCLAELENYPDVTFGFNWIATASDGISPVANGNDAFMLTLGMNLPVYKKRIDAGVREAQTRALANTRKYDRLKDETMEEVADLFAKINSQQENLRLFRDEIIPKQKLSLEQSIDDYQVGKVDFLQLIENWRQLLHFQIAETRFETDLQQSLASLSRQIGSFNMPEFVSPPSFESSNDELMAAQIDEAALVNRGTEERPLDGN